MKSLSLSSPYVIAAIGLPGAGKSYFSNEFARNFRAPLVDEMYFQKMANRQTDGTMMAAEVLGQIMKTGQTLVFDGHLGTKEERDSLVRFATKRKYKVLFVWVQADVDTAKKRALSQMSGSKYRTKLKSFTPPTEKENYIVISGHHTHATQARTVLKHLTQERAEAAKIVRPQGRPRVGAAPRRTI